MAHIDLPHPTYLFDGDVPFRVTGLSPGQRVTLRLEHVDDVGQHWTSNAELSADALGVADSAEAASRRGSYTGVSAAGLLWSMRPEGVTDTLDFVRAGRSPMHMFGQPGGDRLKPRHNTLSAWIDGVEVDRREFDLTRVGPGVQVEMVADGVVHGVAFHAAPGAPKRGAVLCLTGSGGGVDLGYGPMLASRGFDVLSAAYFAYPGRPDFLRDIELRDLADAAAWMRRRFGVNRVAVQGGSRGGELVLVLLAHFPEVFCGGVAMVPMHNVVAGFDHMRNVHEGASWRLDGQALPYCDVDVHVDGPQAIHSPAGVTVAPHYMRDLTSAAADARCGIPVERMNGRVLLISGREDAMWPSWYGADRVMDRLRAAGMADRGEHLALENVGHFLLAPGHPTTMCATAYHPLARASVACGGQPRATADAGRLIFKRLRQFYGELFGAPASVRDA